MVYLGKCQLTMQHFIPFKKYSNATLARETQQLLEANGIACRLADNGASLDGSFGRGFTDYEIQLYRGDFEKAEKLLEERAAEWIEELPKDYYLFSFTDEELYEVIQKKDKWNEIDYVLAHKLLAERGNPVTEVLEQQLRKQRLDELAEPENAGAVGRRSVIMSYMIYTQKKTLPDGRTVYAYTKKDREKAYFSFIVGIIVIIASAIFVLYKVFA